MKNVHTTIAKAVAAVAFLSAAPLAFAAPGDTQNLVVTATVSGVCRLTNIPTLAFGAIDPSAVGAGGVNGSTTVTYKCTNGTAPATLSASALASTMSDGTNSLPFTITLPVANTLLGTGFSAAAAATTFVVNGNIAQADAQNAVASTGYTKTLTLTLAP